ncbi:MAG TPA: hypothetical protein VFV40_06785 [Nocardioides sp.]|nr:hypothetical protein [Nocardioides sp.]
MDVARMFRDAEETVLEEACATLGRSHVTHYEAAGDAFTRQGLRDLFRLVVDAIADRDLAEMGVYAEQVARRRFDQGFDIAEVQAAFNALEEAMWRHLVDVVDPDELAQSVALLSTVLGYGKDTLARTYVSLASARHVPSLDLRALFAGTG